VEAVHYGRIIATEVDPQRAERLTFAAAVSPRQYDSATHIGPWEALDRNLWHAGHTALLRTLRPKDLEPRSIRPGEPMTLRHGKSGQGVYACLVFGCECLEVGSCRTHYPVLPGWFFCAFVRLAVLARRRRPLLEQLHAMWELDLNDDVSAPAPTARQILCAEQARLQLAALKRTLERLTVPQQREIIGQITGKVYRREMVPAGYED